MTAQQRNRGPIAGITGHSDSSLLELVLAKGYEVHGVIRSSSTFDMDRIDHLYADPHESRPLHRLTESEVSLPTNIGSPEYLSVDKLIQTVVDVAERTMCNNHIQGPVGALSRNFSNQRTNTTGLLIRGEGY
jgi:hypothetical protein